MKIKQLSVLEIEQIAYQLAKNFMDWNEPIPEFGTRFPNILESCLLTPFQQFSKTIFHKGLIEKAAILFYLLIKNHPFKNGNKRIAVAALFYFLYKNGKWIRVSNTELYNFSRWVAESNSKLKDETVLAIQKFLKIYIIELKA